MRPLAALMLLAVLTVGVQQGSKAADDVPVLDISKSCRVDTQNYPSQGGASGCVADEQQARETLVSQWSQFTAENKAQCTQAATDIAGVQSYVELLTCLQMGKAAKRLPKEY